MLVRCEVFRNSESHKNGRITMSLPNYVSCFYIHIHNKVSQTRSSAPCTIYGQRIVLLKIDASQEKYGTTSQSQQRFREIEEIAKMANFIAIFYAPKFITAEKQDIAPIQDLHSAWQIAKFSESDPAAIQDYRRWRNHSWYLDTTVIPFVLANTDMSLSTEEKEST